MYMLYMLCMICTFSLTVGDANTESSQQSAPHEGVDLQTPTTPVTPGAGGGESVERVSMGGESLGSFSEFETVSFADESGQHQCN